MNSTVAGGADAGSQSSFSVVVIKEGNAGMTFPNNTENTGTVGVS